MIILLAHLQYKENYGTRWKFKGGDSVIIGKMTAAQAAESNHDDISKRVDFVINQNELIWNNEMSQQYLIEWELIDSNDIRIMWDGPKDRNGWAVQDLIGATGYDYMGAITDLDQRHGYYFKIDHYALKREAEAIWADFEKSLGGDQ